MAAIDFRLRRADVADTEHLHTFCWRERHPQRIREFMLRCEKLMDARKGYAVVAEYNQKAVGFGLLTLSPVMSEITDLVVTLSLRGTGIGTAIIERLTLKAHSLAVKKLGIGVRTKSPRVRLLYQRLGFSYEYTVPLNLGRGLENVDYLVKILNPDDSQS